MMFEEDGEYYSPSEMFNYINSTMSNSKKKKMMNKRRFSDEQVRSLESIFENETKLEPKKKVQVARELGLEPRQVAIWFQNKRARYKSKQLERDYTILRSSYNALASQFEALKKEKQSLLLQVQKLRDLAAGKPDQEATTRNNNEDGSNSSGTNTKSEESQNNTDKDQSEDHDQHHEVNPDLSMEAGGSENGTTSMISDEGSSENNNYNFETDEMEILKIVEPPIAVDEGNWDDIDSCQWWDFWT